jgi:hypothetical protein
MPRRKRNANRRCPQALRLTSPGNPLDKHSRSQPQAASGFSSRKDHQRRRPVRHAKCDPRSRPFFVGFHSSFRCILIEESAVTN